MCGFSLGQGTFPIPLRAAEGGHPSATRAVPSPPAPAPAVARDQRLLWLCQLRGQILVAAPDGPLAPSTFPFSPATHPPLSFAPQPQGISVGICFWGCVTLALPTPRQVSKHNREVAHWVSRLKSKNLCSRKRAPYGLLSKISTLNSWKCNARTFALQLLKGSNP